MIRGPVVTRKNARGSHNDDTARIAATVWTVTATIQMAGLNPLTWLTAYLDECGRNGGKPPTGRETGTLPALERQPRRPPHLGTATARRINPARITPIPAQPPETATPDVGVPTHGTSEYLRHDSYCMDESGVLITMDPGNWAGDKGYVGHGMITPFKKPAGGELLDWQKEFNTQVNKLRYVIEQVIANFKTWRIMHTDYRRPIETFSTTISAVIALHFCKIA